MSVKRLLLQVLLWLYRVCISRVVTLSVMIVISGADGVVLECMVHRHGRSTDEWLLLRWWWWDSWDNGMLLLMKGCLVRVRVVGGGGSRWGWRLWRR